MRPSKTLPDAVKLIDSGPLSDTFKWLSAGSNISNNECTYLPSNRRSMAECGDPSIKGRRFSRRGFQYSMVNGSA